MKFMVLMKANADSEAGVIPKREQFASMIAFNEQLAKDGVLLAAEGLRPSSKGTRIRFEGGRTTVTDGPFAETKELVAGFWVVEGKSREEIVERFTHVPFERGETIEIREFFEADDFGEVLSPDLRERAGEITL
ncbi:MAG TPA: YciI family protein [Candidatus Sulfotelmatobacter sp.]|nr:YciI family protein [Candidatus Sulfotelmatobacter sp.]